MRRAFGTDAGEIRRKAVHRIVEISVGAPAVEKFEEVVVKGRMAGHRSRLPRPWAGWNHNPLARSTRVRNNTAQITIVSMVAQRQDLVAALVACTDLPFRARARRFARGLSADELQFIAEYLGACILESSALGSWSPCQLASRLPAADRDHKMILLLEYLCRTRNQAVAVRS
jgi:hypothetical protein